MAMGGCSHGSYIDLVINTGLTTVESVNGAQLSLLWSLDQYIPRVGG